MQLQLHGTEAREILISAMSSTIVRKKKFVKYLFSESRISDGKTEIGLRTEFYLNSGFYILRKIE